MVCGPKPDKIDWFNINDKISGKLKFNDSINQVKAMQDPRKVLLIFIFHRRDRRLIELQGVGSFP